MTRTTLAFDPEVLAVARALAEERKITMSEAVNYLIRRGLSAPSELGDRNGFAVFQVPAGAQQFGPEEVEKALTTDDLPGFSQ